MTHPEMKYSDLEQEQFLEVVDRDEAFRRWWTVIHNLRPAEETISVSDALGRVVSDSIKSTVDVPGFDRSNVDGFAVESSATFGASEIEPVILRINNELIHPGLTPKVEIQSGFTTPIATGGMIPRGADAVVMVENTRIVNEGLAVDRAVTPGSHISFAGSDIARGELVVTQGTVLSSRETGLLAAIGLDCVRVRKRPVIGVISSGNEILMPGEPYSQGMVFDANSRLICDAVTESGGVARFLGIVPDNLTEMQNAIQNACQSCDMVILSGGTSKGGGDVSYRAVSEMNPGILVHGVALKPGKPICLAASQQIPIAILPGFPTSAIFTFHEFVAPAIRYLAGLAMDDRQEIHARMATRINSEKGRTEFLLVGLMSGRDGITAFSMGKGSGSVTTFSRADGFLVIPKNQEFVESGERVRITLLGKNLKMADLSIIGSHCMGIDLLTEELARRNIRVKTLWVGSQGGIDAVKRGECDVAGSHLLDITTNTYNLPFLSLHEKMLYGYSRMQGIVFRNDDSRFSGLRPEEVIEKACQERDCRMISRNRGSGTRILIDQILQGRRPVGYNVEVRSHHAVAAALSQNRADWGMTIEPVAKFYNLSFLPVREEEYDLIVAPESLEKPAFQEMLNLIRSEEFQRKLRDHSFILRQESGKWAQ